MCIFSLEGISQNNITIKKRNINTKTDPEEVHSGSEKGMGTRIEFQKNENPISNTTKVIFHLMKWNHKNPIPPVVHIEHILTNMILFSTDYAKASRKQHTLSLSKIM